MRAKMPPYALLLSDRQRWPWPEADDCRILFVVPSHQRLHNVVQSIAKEPAAAYARLAVTRDIQPERLLSEPIWHDVDGQRRSILPR